MTRGGLVASRRWQAGKPTDKLKDAKWEAMRGEESDSRIGLIKPWETMCHRPSAAARSGLGKSADRSEGNHAGKQVRRRER